MPRLAIVSSAIAACLAGSAVASSPDAWAEYEQEVTTACFAASGFKEPKAHTDLILFGDDVGRDAVIVEGIYPQPHMSGAKGMMLCLFDKAARKAAVSEILHKE
jgi:hypothetical protein